MAHAAHQLARAGIGRGFLHQTTVAPVDDQLVVTGLKSANMVGATWHPTLPMGTRSLAPDRLHQRHAQAASFLPRAPCCWNANKMLAIPSTHSVDRPSSTLMSTVTVRSSAVYRAVRGKKPCRLPVCPTDSRGPGALSIVPSP